MKFISTRDNNVVVSGAEAIVKGISADGGLFVPSEFPQLTPELLTELCDMTYPEKAATLMSKFMDEFDYAELLDIAEKAYGRFEDADEACPVVVVDEGVYVMELWHGPTYAFKDVALTVLPYLLTASKKKLGIDEKTLILVATSGDTGKAALEGFKDVEGTDIMVFYPNDGVSLMQQLQMSTQAGANVYVAAIEGNFDDAQTAVKKIFTDKSVQEELKGKGYAMSSANSINWGRLMPQIVYYVSAYCDMINSEEISVGDEINFCVPCGNFGDVLAGYYAKRMGLPVKNLICASNVNNVLTDFFATGTYDISGRDFHKTISPSMDILISSNLERLIFELTDRSGEKTAALMQELKEKGTYTVSKELLEEKIPYFFGDFASEEDTLDTIANYYEQSDYLLDPHTAVAAFVANEYYLNEEDETATVILSTANPYKFACDVYRALNDGKREPDPFKAAKRIALLSAEPIPDGIKDLELMERRFTDVLKADELRESVLQYIDKRA